MNWQRYNPLALAYERLIWALLLLVLFMGWLCPDLPLFSLEMYDRNRQFQLIWLWLALPLCWFVLHSLPVMACRQTGWIRLWLPLSLIALLLLTAFTLQQPALQPVAPHQLDGRDLAFRDLMLQWLLATITAVLAMTAGLRQTMIPALTSQSGLNQTWPSRVLAILPLLPLSALGWMLYSLVVSSGRDDWHAGFANIRMYDDALLPLLWLLWLRPNWWQSARYLPCLLIISGLFSLSLWLDGARAVLLATLCGLSVATAVMLRTRAGWRRLLPYWGSFAIGLLVFLLIRLLPDDGAYEIVRTDSSGRTDLWLRSWQHWQARPLWGTGGDQFGRLLPFVRSMHPHNLPLQWLGEWGLAGLLALVMAGYGIWSLIAQLYRRANASSMLAASPPDQTRIMPRRVMQQQAMEPHSMEHQPMAKQSLKQQAVPLWNNSNPSLPEQPALAIGAVIALVINSCLSGMLVYPLSQMGTLALVCWILWLAHYPFTFARFDETPASQIVIAQATRKILIFSMGWGAAILIMIHLGDAFSRGHSVDDQNAPRFWQYGRALHLSPP